MRFKDELALTGDGDAIWRRVSDLGAIPTYWVAIRSGSSSCAGHGDESIVNIEFVFGGRRRGEDHRRSGRPGPS